MSRGPGTNVRSRQVRRGHSRHASESGYALLLVFCLSALIGISMFVAVPRLMFEAQRQQEQLLIDRGEQYTVAIRRFRLRTGRYPGSMDELESFQGTRFLRRRYKDPMTASGDWRLIHIDGAGIMIDSKIRQTGISRFGTLQPSAGNLEAGTAHGSTPDPAASSADNPGAEQQQQPLWARRIRSSDGAPAVTDSNAQIAPEQQGQQGAPGFAPAPATASSPGTGQASPADAGLLQSTAGSVQQVQAGGAPGFGNTQNFAPLNGVGGAGGPGIAGVASNSERAGIKLYNEHARYDEWEFVFDLRKLLQRQMARAFAQPPESTTNQPVQDTPPQQP